MGWSMISTHILNKDVLTKEQFAKKFSEMIEAKGYTAADEGDAELTLALAFSSGGKWVTVLEMDSQGDRREAARYAKSLETIVVYAELVDSDFAEISLFDKTGAQVDALTLGTPYYDEAPMGSPLKWQTLLGVDWAEVEKIQNADHIFAETALSDFAAIIGVESENILLEQADIPDRSEVTLLYFKKSGEEKLTLKTAFCKIFGEALAPLGFVQTGLNHPELAGLGLNHPYLARVVNGDILHIITYFKNSASSPTRTEYKILIGVGTVYRYLFDLNLGPENKIDWLKSNHWLYAHTAEDIDREFASEILNITCDSTDEASIVSTMERWLEITKQVALPLLNEVKDIDSCIKYLRNMGVTMKIFDDADFGKTNPENKSNEGYLYFLTPNYASLIENRIESLVKQYKRRLDAGAENYTQEHYRELLERKPQAIEREIAKIENVINDAALHERLMAELERRKRENLVRLHEVYFEVLGAGADLKQQPKKLTLNAAFKQVFGAELEGRGFKLIKGGCMYVRVLNGEIAHFVTVEKEETYRDYLPVEKEVIEKAKYEGRLFDYIVDYTRFNVLCSLKTLYENELPFKVTKFTNFMSNYDMCFDVPAFDKEKASEIRSFTYQTDNNESLLAAMEYCFEVSKEIMLPQLDSINNVDKYVQFMRQCYFSNDVYYKCRNYHDIIKSDYEKDIYNERQYIERNYAGNVEGHIDAEMKRISNYYDKLLGQLDDTVNDPTKLAQKIAEMEEQKKNNIEQLKALGIEI